MFFIRIKEKIVLYLKKIKEKFLLKKINWVYDRKRIETSKGKKI